MRLTINQPSPGVLVVSAEVPSGRPCVLIADTATTKGPMPLEEYVAVQGGIRPIRQLVEEIHDARDVHGPVA